MNILVISPEAGITTSALATAVNQMTEAFARVGTTALTCSPLYKRSISDFSKFRCIFTGVEKLYHKPFEVWQSDNALHTFIYNEEFFDREDVYGIPNEVPYQDNHIRYTFLSAAALEYALATKFSPTAILGHEWGGAPAGSLIRTVYAEYFAQVPFFLTVHNINYDFLVSESEIERLGLERADYNMDGYEYWGKASLLKAGILYAKKVLVPSLGYRNAIINSNVAGGLTGFLRRNEEKIKGIQFGVNYSLWDFNLNSGATLIEAKKKAKEDLAKLVGVDFEDRLLVYAHLDKESGNTSETLSTLLADLADLNVFTLIGMQEDQPEWNYYNSIALEYPHNFCVRNLGDSTELLQKYLAGADMLFAGSLREPSTSVILKALASGTIPLTGRGTGVANMLSSYSDSPENANAFLVEDPNSPVLMLRSMRTCHEMYHSNAWNILVQNAYNFRYGWDRTILQYVITLGEI